VLAVGDAAFQKKCLGKMDEVASEGRTVLFVSHQMDMIKNICQHGILLSEGNIISKGGIEDIVRQYQESFSDIPEKHFFCANRDDENYEIQILEGRILSQNGGSSTIYDTFDEVKLQIKYVVRKQLIGSNVNFELRRNGILLAMSFDTDLNAKLIDCRKPGRYNCIISLPQGIFRPGHYTVSVGTGILNERVIQRLEDILSFEVQLLSQPSSFVSYADKRPGLIALPLTWEENLIESDDLSDINSNIVRQT